MACKRNINSTCYKDKQFCSAVHEWIIGNRCLSFYTDIYCKSITDAIASFLTPNNCTNLCSFFGLANQLPASTNTISYLLALHRPLLCNNNDFLWSPTHSSAFNTAKQQLTIAPTTLSFFDLCKPT